MRLAVICFVLLQLVFSQPLFSQPVDTVNKTTGPTRRNLEEAVKMHREWQDSIDRERLLQQIEKNGKSLDAFIAEGKEKERKEKRRQNIRIGAGVVFLFVLFFTIARRYKQRTRP